MNCDSCVGIFSLIFFLIPRIFKNAGNLSNVASLVPLKERYTEWYDRNRDCVDQGGEFKAGLVDAQWTFLVDAK
jgi:hypothetical protein